MEVNVNKIQKGLESLREQVEAASSLTTSDKRLLRKFEQSLEAIDESDLQNLLQWLSEHFLDAAYTELIAANFEEFLLIILSKSLHVDDEKQRGNVAEAEPFEVYQRKCIALAKLLRHSVAARKYATTFFRSTKSAPFENNTTNNSEGPPRKKSRVNSKTLIAKSIDNLDILRCCYQLLNSDPNFYKELWNWSVLVEKYLNVASEHTISKLEKLYFNHILAILANMSEKQLTQLNVDIPPDVLLQFDDEEQNGRSPNAFDFKLDIEKPKLLSFNFKSDTITNIEGVLLPVFNKDNFKFYAKNNGVHEEEIVKVDSTKVNLRSIAMGIAASKTICLSGPVGCGKTTLVQYIARKTGRICPKINREFESQNRAHNKENSMQQQQQQQQNGFNGDTIVKETTMEECFEDSLTDLLDVRNNNGFLRIQLGDQTDSKMLLGQYRCTDVPGEFIWLPGILTQAVMNGYWLLLEDLDSATQDTYTILSGLLENNYLTVPGFRDCVKIQPGFQLFVTVRTHKSMSNSSQKALFSLLEKYLYTINILPLSRNELCKVVSTNYPKLATVANRIVDVFLTFSSGDHNVADNLRQQETGDKADNTENYVSLPFEAVSLAGIPNAGRLVSTRDLIKLCQRSNPVFSVTSTECAYFVFQNAVDVFCSNLPQGKEKTKLIVSIGAKLGIIQSRCETYANDYKPEINFDSECIKVGRAELYAKRYSRLKDSLGEGNDFDFDGVAAKRQKLNFEAEKCLKLQKRAASSSRATFSFTRLASCLLERIAVCVAHSEPVLLVGETGVGKTSSVQYLAERTEHKLVVVNMNNQSDVSDLIGSFKPVDLTYVLSPLREEFEFLFRETFDSNKNAQFLSKFGTCFNENLFTSIVKMMIKVADSILSKSPPENANKLPIDISVLIPRWRHLKTKLLKLDSQLSKSINISFAFIPGSLVNCIKNGDWVLLDEINLASAETLECLSTILEPDGSVVLLEKGDFTPVRRHSDFRIFACMNPNTDIGKKDLPIGIRNRFTEFFVDELTTDNDLSLLVSDYLIKTGIQRKSVTNIVKLYKKLRQLARLELNDGLGNRPVYSLRTLCRSLRICAKNLCGSIERNLYESFCMSFLTQLDTDSHRIVLTLIQTALLSNVKAVLKQSIPKPSGNYLDFEGYWIEQGPKPVQECANYILTESVRANLKDLARIISIGKLPILLQGPTSAGKTSLIEYVAKRSGNHCLRINNHEHTDLQEYVGTYVADATTGNLCFREGVLVQAMRNGYWIILDELNLASTEILEALNRVLDDNRELFIPETQTVVNAHPNFMLFATQNPPGLYGGRKTLSRAFKNRFIELHFSEIPRHELETILEKRCFIPPSYAKKMVMCMADLQKNRSSTSKNVFTLRDLFRWGNRYTYADKRLLQDNKYDWNQHLIEEGYLVLSAKVRTELEIHIIEDALYRNFKKHIDLSRLFNVKSTEDQCSPVTSQIIESIKSFRERTDIVWTQNMTRMAVMTAKALQFDEPVLLVGPTGCGKTTVCQLLARIRGVQLRILNCHMHTESADFLGGLRPYRQDNNIDDDGNRNGKIKLFEWADGPLINAMQEGSYFMADEISLAEDSVLERLNCILEPERTVLLAEKGGIAINDGGGKAGRLDEAVISSEFCIQAQPGFQFLATMNPGGDFGKKELSPALRNRFTEIWCLPSEAKEDLIQIAANCMNELNEQLILDNALNCASYIVEVVLYIHKNVEKFKFSVRDILAWAQYMICNANLSFPERAIFGLETIFLDSLEMLPHESIERVDALGRMIKNFAISSADKILGEKFTYADVESKRGQEVTYEDKLFGLSPFLIPVNPSSLKPSTLDFSFSAPTTKKNLFRLLSALSLKKPILLEGPPGVGKTSIVENLARAIGYHIVRINLCEHTDLADLFGTDLPAEDNVLDESSEKASKGMGMGMGSFVWRDGPILSALKADNTWILLDELNLAPQSVLEGLNAILDHRGEVYIPELNKTFILNKSTRIFACQNPLRQGGGRKGLPQSFLNRFNKVYLRKLTTEDLKHVVNEKYGMQFEELKQKLAEPASPLMKYNFSSANIFDLRHEVDKSNAEFHKQQQTESSLSLNLEFDLSDRLVRFSEALDNGVAQMEFGYKGGPYEFNLRDILRWCEFFIDSRTGIQLKSSSNCQEAAASVSASASDDIGTFIVNFDSFMQTLYDTMKIVYIQRMRSLQDQEYIRNVFGRIFQCDCEHINKVAEDVSIYWTAENLYLNDLVLKRDSASTKQQQHQLRVFANRAQSPLLLSAQREHLQNLVACVQHQKPILLCGSTDTGKTKLIDAICTISNQVCNTDNIDDSVTGSFQQIDLNRHIEDLSQNIECIFWNYMQELIFNPNEKYMAPSLLHMWFECTIINKSYQLEPNQQTSNDVPKELQLFRKRLDHLVLLAQKLSQQAKLSEAVRENLRTILGSLKSLKNYTKYAETLNMGGSFEWVDSKIVKSLKYGHYIALEHVNLCSSAVLDRLNPVFEPNGSLLISEKGVVSAAIDAAAAEVVAKSANFHAFLTIDPKNGELSRAMRNRCIEISLQKDAAYTTDDMRQIIYSHGVHDIWAINCILRMHNNIKASTEINNYSVSHINQCAFLVASYKNIGYATKNAIYVSGMEVYVYSANTDLMGFGLAYYQNKLRDIVLEHANKYAEMIAENMNITRRRRRRRDYLAPLILRCGDLNQLTLIKLQAMPLIFLLENSEPNRISNLGLYLQNVQNNSLIESDAINYDQFLRFYVYALYEISSLDDLDLRKNYLQKILINKGGGELQTLSMLLYECLKLNSKEEHTTTTNHHLPWNPQMFPRIREYNNYPWNPHVYNLSGLLIKRVLLHSIPKENQLTNLSNLSALNYSRALNRKLVTAKSNHTFLNQLSNLMEFLSHLLENQIASTTLDMSSLVMLTTRLLWYNRLLSLAANESIFNRKEINMNLLDKLMLHYEWLSKHLLRFLADLSHQGITSYQEFGDIFVKIDEFIAAAKPKLNRIRKLYTKNIMAFQPYYKSEQLDLHHRTKQLDQLISVIPRYGSFTEGTVLRKFMCQKSTAALKARAIINKLDSITTNSMSNVGQLISSSVPVPNEIRAAFQDYANAVFKEENSNNSTSMELELSELKVEIDVLKNLLNTQDDDDDDDGVNDAAETSPKDIELGLHSLKEYFITKALTQRVYMIWQENSLEFNLSYCDDLPTLCNDTWHLIRMQTESNFEQLLRLIKNILLFISKCKSENTTSLGEFVKILCGRYKEINALWRNSIYKCQKRQLLNLATNFRFTQINKYKSTTEQAEEEEELTADKCYEGPPLVNICISLLFQSDGSIKPIPLKDLHVWKEILNQMNQILWQNAILLTSNYDQLLNNSRIAELHAEKLLLEIECGIGFGEGNGQVIEDDGYEDDYRKLLNEMQLQLDECRSRNNNENSSSSAAAAAAAKHFQQLQYNTALLNALIGAVELSTLTTTPLIDPVEKKRLKKLYLQEDINNLKTLCQVYDMMRIVLNYKHFGSAIYDEYVKELDNLKIKQLLSDQSLALRPNECLYIELVQNIKHYLNTNCLPAALLKLLQQVKDIWRTSTSAGGGSNADYDGFQMPVAAAAAAAALNLLRVGCRETSMKLTLWISNAQRFIYHVLKPYQTGYYEDFMQPLQCAVQQFIFGLDGLKTVLCQIQNSITEVGSNYTVHSGGHIHKVIGNFAEFPNTRVLKATAKSSIISMDNIAERLRMLRLRLDALSKHVHIANELTEETFDYLNATLAEYNEIWQLEEEQLRRRKAEEDSLYVHKTTTKCETEDEDVVEQQEINLYFPTHVEQDYGDYLNTDTLEQIKPKTPTKINSIKQRQILNDELVSEIVQEFIELIENHTQVSYYHQRNADLLEGKHNSADFLSMAKKRLQCFAMLYARHKFSLNDWLDDHAYNGLCLAVSIQKRCLNDVPENISIGKSKSYNFYIDSNIPEIVACTDLLDRIRQLVKIQLDLYPEHASLIDIQKIIATICQLPSDAPLVRFSTGFQLLRQRVAQWNEVAHKNNHLKNEEVELAEYVQKWMRLELQCWRNCLNQAQNKVEARAYRYWFYIYNLLQEFLKNEELDSSLTDIKYVEKRFGGGAEILDAVELSSQGKQKTNIMDIIKILRQFIEASCYGDFHVRMRILQAFEFYLQNTKRRSEEEEPTLDLLISGLRNLQIYFAQFTEEIIESKQSMRTPIEKKLKEFVKIESYNKDLSYFSMRNNVARVHRNLSKFIKEYREQLQQKITPVFQPQDATVKDYNFENVKGKALRFDGKVKYNLMLDVKYFMAPIELNDMYKNASSSLLKEDENGGGGGGVISKAAAAKHFLTSRNVVKSTILHTTYPQMIMALDELLTGQLERCEHLRSLSVDRNKERPKQVLEAKQILQQKRKGLTDLFKILTQLGISYKSGLLEQSLNTQLVDYTLPPFCVRNMLCMDAKTTTTPTKDKQVICANMLQLYENLDRYYAKSVFKLRLLQNIMLKPLSELGPPNIERIKGFSISMFLLVQQQRRLLAETTRECHALKLCLKQLRSLTTNFIINSNQPPTAAAAIQRVNFVSHTEIFNAIKRSSTQICYVLEQFDILLDCAPSKAIDSHQVFTNSIGILTKDSNEYVLLAKLCKKCLESVRRLLQEMPLSALYDLNFLNFKQIESLTTQHENLVQNIEKMREMCKVSNVTVEYLPIAKPLTALLAYIQDVMKAGIGISPTLPTNDSRKSIEEDPESKIGEIVHSTLLSLQKLYKNHPKPELDKSTDPKSSAAKRNAAILEDEEIDLQDNHLRTLYNSLSSDWSSLNAHKISKSIDGLLHNICKTQPPGTGTGTGTSVNLIQLNKLAILLPILEQYYLLAEYQLLQQLGAHKVSAKMLSIMLTVFIEVSSKGFCIPPDLMQDEEQGEGQKNQKEGEGFGLEDGTGEKDASDKIESEDQLDDAKRPEDRKNNQDQDQQKQDCKEEKGIEMSEDFEAEMQDIEKPENEEDDSGESENEDELNKEMGETEEGAEKLDEQIWGDDEEPDEKQEEEDTEMKDEEEGKGTQDEKDSHNDLDTKNDAAKNKDEKENENDKNGLDATDEAPNQEDKRKQQKPDIDNIKDPELDEDQNNPFHNELEEPPEAEEMDLGEMKNNDGENDNDDNNEQEDNENPFDIDSMKQNIDPIEEEKYEEGEDEEKEKNANEDAAADSSGDSDDENGAEHDKEETPPENTQDGENEQENDDPDDDPDTQRRGDKNDEEEEEEKPEDEKELEKEKHEEKPEEHAPSQDKSSKEKNVQSMPKTEDKASADQAVDQDENEDKNIKQEQELDQQETGEEKDGIGQAENEENDGGHQGIAETDETVSKDNRKNEKQTKEKRKQGRTNEERSLGEADKNKIKQLKTIDKLKEENNKNEETDKDDDENKKDLDSEEYQHVKEPKNSDKTTLDNATEEQSKKIQHQEDEEKKDDDDDNVDNEDIIEDVMETSDTEDPDKLEELEKISSEKNDKKSEKPSKSNEMQERTETEDHMEVEGEVISTMTVSRSNDTTSHCNKELLLDSTLPEEMTAAELLEMRKMYHQQIGTNKTPLPDHENYESWQIISNRMSQNARELCEQLRLILEPTKCTRLKGDYRTGRRINMKKIIPYIASQFRKDKIWLRRTKPAQRDYKITIAIDDSKSMHHNNSKILTLEAISLVSQALRLLESGRLSVVSFGEKPEIILNHTEQFDGPKLVTALNFSQEKTKIAELLDFIRTINTEEGGAVGGSDNALFENLLLILSDGRNIFSEGRTKVKNSIKLARLQRIFLVYVIIDNPENKNSILDIQTMERLPDSRINIKSYLDDFPFPYYVIVRDLNQLPLVLSEAMRQWFELVNSEQ